MMAAAPGIERMPAVGTMSFAILLISQTLTTAAAKDWVRFCLIGGYKRMIFQCVMAMITGVIPAAFCALKSHHVKIRVVMAAPPFLIQLFSIKRNAGFCLDFHNTFPLSPILVSPTSGPPPFSWPGSMAGYRLFHSMGELAEIGQPALKYQRIGRYARLAHGDFFSQFAEI